MEPILIVILLVIVFGSSGVYFNRSRNPEADGRWTYGGGFGVILVIVLLLWFFGYLPHHR